MKLIIDGKQKKVDISERCGLDSLLETIKTLLTPGKRFLKTITIDGVLLNKKSEKALNKKKVSNINEIVVETESPLMLAEITLKNADDYLVKFIPELKKFSDSLQFGGDVEEYDTFLAYVKGWISVVQLIDAVKSMMKVDFKKIKVKNQSVAVINSNLQKVLNQVVNAFKNQDYVYLQDLIKYELVPSVEKMRLVVALLRKNIKNAK